MRKIGAISWITALAAVVASILPAAAFGFRLGPFHFGLPLVGHHYHHHHLYMRATSHEARTRLKYVARSKSGASNESGSPRGTTSALLYPSIALPSIIEDIFFPSYSSSWPFDYQVIFTAAFAETTRQDPTLCRASFDPSAIIGRISNEVSPTADRLQRLGGALGAASGFLERSCPQKIPGQPVARLSFMESQLEELAMALNMVRQPLLDFEQSLNADQQSRLVVASSQEAVDRLPQSGNIAGGCVSPGEIEWSINEINQSVQPTTTQRDALKRSFDEAAKDLEAHCPTTIPTTALSRLDTIQARLDSTWRATLSIQVALANFEAELSDAQKVHFDTLNFAAQ